MSSWESHREWDQSWDQSCSGWRGPDRPGDSAGQASGWWRDPETHAGFIAHNDLTEARMAAAAEHGGVSASWCFLSEDSVPGTVCTIILVQGKHVDAADLRKKSIPRIMCSSLLCR